MEMEQRDNKTMDFKTVKRKLYIEKAKRKLKEFGEFAKEVYNENKQIILPVAGGLVVKAMKDGYKTHKRNKERREEECRMYDYRTHNWTESRRPLTPREYDQLQDYIDNGGRIRDWLKMKKLHKD